MESPTSRTRGKFVSFAWEIQMWHHSMDSREGGVVLGSAEAELIATPAVSKRGISRFIRTNRLVQIVAVLWRVTIASAKCKIPGDCLDQRHSWTRLRCRCR